MIEPKLTFYWAIKIYFIWVITLWRGGLQDSAVWAKVFLFNLNFPASFIFHHPSFSPRTPLPSRVPFTSSSPSPFFFLSRRPSSSPLLSDRPVLLLVVRSYGLWLVSWQHYNAGRDKAVTSAVPLLWPQRMRWMHLLLVWWEAEGWGWGDGMSLGTPSFPNNRIWCICNKAFRQQGREGEDGQRSLKAARKEKVVERDWLTGVCINNYMYSVYKVHKPPNPKPPKAWYLTMSQNQGLSCSRAMIHHQGQCVFVYVCPWCVKEKVCVS